MGERQKLGAGAGLGWKLHRFLINKVSPKADTYVLLCTTISEVQNVNCPSAWWPVSISPQKSSRDSLCAWGILSTV